MKPEAYFRCMRGLERLQTLEVELLGDHEKRELAQYRAGQNQGE